MNFKSFYNVNEEQEGSEEEYSSTYKKYFDTEELNKEVKKTEDALKRFGVEIQIKKTDSDNIVLKYGIDDLNKTVYILGLFSKTGNMLKSDYRDMKQWIDTLIQKLNDGYTVMTSPNKNSMKFIDSIMKKDPSIKMRNIGNVDLSHLTKDDKQKEIWKWTTIVLKK